MTADGRWARVDRLFGEALERPPAARGAFLDEACGGDAGLRAEVDRLLAADEGAGAFLETPVGLAAPGRDGEPAEEEGRLGPYRLLRRLGRGGMGTVYLARRDDAEYEREVAVKVLHSGLEDTEAYHRFLAERQILARLEHPNVARLYDGGTTPDGRPFLVLELVDGLPIDVYCDRHRLPVERRLDLFLRVCGAVQYAHQNLLVHRDLKPANILVTEAGEPKLLDFGIAKQLGPEAADSGPLTRTGLRVMTPSYASPEQVRGEAITTASDVYSLGVLLYELLAGRGPYRLTSGLPHEIEAAICGQEPERPSQALAGAAARRLRGDLDNVVLRALRKEPERRYASAAALAQDLRNHLASLPVAARPDTLAYRARKFARRHRAAVATAAAVVLLVAGFVASLLAQGRQLARERDKARYTLDFLVDTFRGADPLHNRGEKLTAREILDQGAGRVRRELSGRPDVQAALLDAIGQADLGLGRVEEAAPLLESALDLRRRTRPGTLEEAQAMDRVADVRAFRSDYAGAEALLRRSLALKRRLPGRGPGEDLEVARTLNQLGDLLARRQDWKSAEPLHREALALARRAEGASGPTVAATLVALASRRTEVGDYPGAERLLGQGLAMEVRLLGERDAGVLRHQRAYGELLIGQGKYPEAEKVLRRALNVERGMVDPGHPDMVTLLSGLAVARQGQGDFAGAEALDRRALAAAEAAYGPADAHVADVLGDLGSAVENQGRLDEAAALMERALAIRRRTFGERNPLVAHSLLHLAEVRRRMGQTAVALPLARQALSVAEGTMGRDHPLTAYPNQAVGLVLKDQGRPGEAEPYLHRAMELLARAVPPGSPELAKSRVVEAECLAAVGRLDEAEGLLRQAEPVLLSRLGAGSVHGRKARALSEEIARRRAAGAGKRG